MPVPKYRTSKSKRNMRRSHHALSAPGLSVCSNCNEVKRPHVACHACGHYAGKQVMEPKANLGWDKSGVDFDTEA
ncbi:MAG: 50S ribosomal protein L32 [Bdellovibrionota bacterium]